MCCTPHIFQKHLRQVLGSLGVALQSLGVTISFPFFGDYLYPKHLRHWLISSIVIDDRRILQSDWKRTHFVLVIVYIQEKHFRFDCNSLVFCSQLFLTWPYPEASQRHKWKIYGSLGTAGLPWLHHPESKNPKSFISLVNICQYAKTLRHPSIPSRDSDDPRCLQCDWTRGYLHLLL